MLFALSGCKLFQCRAKHPSCFIHNDDTIIQQHAWCALQRRHISPSLIFFHYFSPSLSLFQSLHCYFDLILSSLQHSSPFSASLPKPFPPFLFFSQLMSSPIAFQFLGSLLISLPHFFSFLPSSLLFLSSPLCFPLIYLP